MLKKVITLVTVIAVVGLLSVAAAFASERTRVRDEVVQDSAGLQIMEAEQLQTQLQAQDPATGGDTARIRNREQVKTQVQSLSADPVPNQEQNRLQNQARLMSQDHECLDCDGPVRDRDRIQDSDGNVGANRANGPQDRDGAGPNGSQGSGGSRGGKS